MGRRKAANEMPAGSVDVDGTGGIEAEVSGSKPRRPRAVTSDPDQVDVEIDVGEFMKETADGDRKKTKAKHVDDGLKAVAEMVDRMKKGLAYAACLHDLEAKLAVLSEVADTAANVTDDARRAVRNAKAEKRNLQP